MLKIRTNHSNQISFIKIIRRASVRVRVRVELYTMNGVKEVINSVSVC